MTRKTRESYTAVLRYIEDNIYKLQPVLFMTDFETAMRNALSVVYENVRIRGCWFHYCQAIRRKCAKINKFFNELDKYPDAKKIYHKFLALPLLPAMHITTAYEMLRMAAEKNHAKIFEAFLKYYGLQWLGRVSVFLYVCYMSCVRL